MRLQFASHFASIFETVRWLENRSSLLIQTGFNLSDHQQQPSWINENIKQECILYFCYNDGTDDLDLQKIPLS